MPTPPARRGFTRVNAPPRGTLLGRARDHRRVARETSDETTTSPRWRGRLARTLTVLGALLAFVSIAANFVERQVLDSEEFEETAAQLIENPTIRAEVASTLADELFASVDVAAELEAALPAEQKPLAGPIAGAVRPLAERVALEILERPRFQRLWVDTLGVAHAQVIRLLDDEARFVETEGGVVALDLRPLLVELTDQLPLVPDLSSRLPEGAGLVTVVEADELETAQTATRVLRALADWVWVLALVAWTAAVALALDRRRELRAVAVGLTIVGVVVLVARRVAGRYVVDELSASPTDGAARETWDVLTRLLADAGIAATAVGLLALAGAWLVGSSSRAAQARARLVPSLRRPGTAFGAAGVLYLLLVLWGPISYVQRPGMLLVLAVLLALGVEVLRRAVAREHPVPDPSAPSPREIPASGPPEST